MKLTASREKGLGGCGTFARRTTEVMSLSPTFNGESTNHDTSTTNGQQTDLVGVGTQKKACDFRLVAAAALPFLRESWQ